jgi:hypothetical protein
MPNSARALGQDGLRLRSRRVRSDRSPRLSVSLPVALFVVAGLVGFVSASVRFSDFQLPSLSQPVYVPGWMPGPSTSPVRSLVSLVPTIDEQRYLQALWPIHTRLQQRGVRLGLTVATFGAHVELDRAQLKVRLDDALAGFRVAEEQLRALQPPTDLQEDHASYLDAVRLLQDSAVQMLRTCDDGKLVHLTEAVPLSLEGLSQMQLLGDRWWPAS